MTQSVYALDREIRWMGACILALAAYHLTGHFISAVSPRVLPQIGVLGGVVGWVVIAFGASGLMRRQNWARRLMLAYTVLEAVRFGWILIRVFPGVAPDAFGAFILVLRVVCYALAIRLLFRARAIASKNTEFPREPKLWTMLAPIAIGIACSLVPAIDTDPVTLQDLPRNADGELEPLVEIQLLTGQRWRVTGMSDGYPVTEDVGPWRIQVIQSPDGTSMALDGLLFAEQFDVSLDLERNALVIDETVFPGRPIDGNSPILRDAAFTGVTFQRSSGRIRGKASILFIEDGSILADFDKVYVDGRRAGEYGILTPSTD